MCTKKEQKVKFITFSGLNEIIVTRPKDYEETFRIYFGEGGRNIDEYDREEIFDKNFCIYYKKKGRVKISLLTLPLVLQD